MVSNLGEAGVGISFGEKHELVFNVVSFPFEVEIGRFVRKTFPCSYENSFFVDSLHAKMDYNNFFDSKRLPEFGEGVKIFDSKMDCCEVCELYNSKN